MSKNFDVIPADRELARQLVGLPFDQAVEEIAAHREQHSVMAGEHLNREDEDLIVIALQQCNTPGVEDLVKKIQNNYYLVLTPFSQERAAQMVKDQAAAKINPTPEKPHAWKDQIAHIANAMAGVKDEAELCSAEWLNEVAGVYPDEGAGLSIPGCRPVTWDGKYPAAHALRCILRNMLNGMDAGSQGFEWVDGKWEKASKPYREEELSEAIARATDRTMPPIPHLPEIEGIEVIDDFRQQCALKAMEMFMARHPVTAAIIYADLAVSAFRMADEMVAARDGLRSTVPQKGVTQELWDIAAGKMRGTKVPPQRGD